MHFTYDAVGPATVTYNGTVYYYLRNAQGDVTGIANAAGQTVVTYTYDAWGNPLTATGAMAATLGEDNPLRYRGYVYDTETGLYYLKSRYYSPERGRFINADGYVSTGQGVLGNNMFAYCNSNPSNMTDEDGKIPYRTANVRMTDGGIGNIGYYLSYLLKKYGDMDDGTMVAVPRLYREMSMNQKSWYGKWGASLSHTNLPDEDQNIVIENDMICADVGGGLGLDGIEYSAGIYLATTSFSIRLIDEMYMKVEINFGVGVKASLSPDRVGKSMIWGLGGGVSLAWDSQTKKSKGGWK